MDPEQKKALIGSIEKWRKIVDKKGYDQGVANCPLCILNHAKNPQYDICCDCPVSMKTTLPGCNNTPYSNWADHHAQKHPVTMNSLPGLLVRCNECIRLAKNEMAFLESLLPGEEDA